MLICLYFGLLEINTLKFPNCRFSWLLCMPSHKLCRSSEVLVQNPWSAPRCTLWFCFQVKPVGFLWDQRTWESLLEVHWACSNLWWVQSSNWAFVQLQIICILVIFNLQCKLKPLEHMWCRCRDFSSKGCDPLVSSYCAELCTNTDEFLENYKYR